MSPVQEINNIEPQNLLSIENGKRENIKVIINLGHWLYTDIFLTGNAITKSLMQSRTIISLFTIVQYERLYQLIFNVF